MVLKCRVFEALWSCALCASVGVDGRVDFQQSLYYMSLFCVRLEGNHTINVGLFCHVDYVLFALLHKRFQLKENLFLFCLTF